MPAEAPYVRVYDPAQVRQAELSRVLLAQEVADLDTATAEDQLLDLVFGVEEVARRPLSPEQATILAYLIETYGLLAVGLDPFLRPLLPAIPATGAAIQRLVLGVNGGVALVNGARVGVGARLIPAEVPDPTP